MTFALYAAGVGLVAAVLGLGRIVWWTQPWIGQALALAIPLLAAAIFIEHHRANPLLNTRWLASADILRFAVVVVMARIVLSEQTTSAVGLLNLLARMLISSAVCSRSSWQRRWPAWSPAPSH